MSTVTENTRHMTASVVAYDPTRDAVLLVHHNAHGYWQFPGGHVDPDEAPDEAALRELVEETGVRAVHAQAQIDLPGMTWRPTPIAVYEIPAPPKPHKGEPAHSHIDYLYAVYAQASDGLEGPASEVSGVKWVPVDQLHELAGVRDDVYPMVQTARAVVRDFAAKQHEMFGSTDHLFAGAAA